MHAGWLPTIPESKNEESRIEDNEENNDIEQAPVLHQSEIEEISRILADFDEMMKVGNQRGNRYVAGTVFSLGTLITSFYFWSQTNDDPESAVAILLFALTMASLITTCLGGCMSVVYCHDRSSGNSIVLVPNEDEFAELIRALPDYEVKSELALEVIRDANLPHPTNEQDPYGIHASLKEVVKNRKKEEMTNNKQEPFWARCLPRLSQSRLGFLSAKTNPPIAIPEKPIEDGTLHRGLQKEF